MLVWLNGLYNITLNGEQLTTNSKAIGYDETHETGNIPVDGSSIDFVGVIDLDENDNYKEIIVERIYGINGEVFIYRVKKDGLELLLSMDTSWDEGLVKINGRWIYAYSFYVGEYAFLYGYELYENGKFIHIDRFATGEKLCDENGIYPENFKKLTFGPTGEGAHISKNKDEYYPILGSGTTYSFISKNSDDTYNIKVHNDTEWTDLNVDGLAVHEAIPAGTILKNVKFRFDW